MKNQHVNISSRNSLKDIIRRVYRGERIDRYTANHLRKQGLEKLLELRLEVAQEIFNDILEKSTVTWLYVGDRSRFTVFDFFDSVVMDNIAYKLYQEMEPEDAEIYFDKIRDLFRYEL